MFVFISLNDEKNTQERMLQKYKHGLKIIGLLRN